MRRVRWARIACRLLAALCVFAVGLAASGTALPRQLQFGALWGFVTKSHSPEPGTAGQNLTYSLAVSNTSPGTVYSVTLFDNLPPGLSPSSMSGACSGTTPVACAVGDLGPSSGSGTYTVVVRPTTGGTYTNSAYASGDVCGDGCIETTPTTTDVATVRSLFTLTVSVSGSGRVTSSPAGIDCPATCSASFVEGTSVSLTATPASGNRLADWGGACGGTASCSVTIDGDRSVSAQFEAVPASVASTAPSITGQPEEEVLYEGQFTDFTAAASGDPSPTVQWQVSTDGARSFSNLAGETSTTLRFRTASAENGNYYRAVFTNSAGSATTRAVHLTVNSPSPPSPAPAPTASTGDADLAVTATFAIGAPSAAGTADLGVRQTAGAARAVQMVDPPPAVEGTPVTLGIVVTNNGPQTATGVVLNEQLGSGLTFQSASASQESCTGTGPIVCALGDLAAGASATVTVTALTTATGQLTATASVSGNESDPNTTNNSEPQTLPVALPPAATPPPTPPPPPILPPPVPGALVNAQPVSGNVVVDGQLFRSPAQLHVGALIDTRGGSIELVTASETAVFYGGVFKLEQTANPNGTTDLVLAPVVPATVCDKTPARKARRTQTVLRPKVLGLLWGTGKGRFRTRGRYSAATVRGTIWLTAERCDGTFTYVKQGSVSLRDQTHKRTIILTAGHSYLAKPH